MVEQLCTTMRAAACPRKCMKKFFKLEADASISPMTTWMKNEHQNIPIDNVRSFEE